MIWKDDKDKNNENSVGYQLAIGEKNRKMYILYH